MPLRKMSTSIMRVRLSTNMRKTIIMKRLTTMSTSMRTMSISTKSMSTKMRIMNTKSLLMITIMIKSTRTRENWKNFMKMLKITLMSMKIILRKKRRKLLRRKDCVWKKSTRQSKRDYVTNKKKLIVYRLNKKQLLKLKEFMTNKKLKEYVLKRRLRKRLII